MAQPNPYSRQFDFTGWSASHPNDQQPGVSIDAEFNAIMDTLSQTLGNLQAIQRDDLQLANGLVGLAQVATDLLAVIASSGGWTPRGFWAATTQYAAKDVVMNNNITYVCTTAHTSSAGFTGDYNLGRWVQLNTPPQTFTIPDGAVTTSKLANGAVTLDKIGLTSLPLTGNLSGATLAAGTATPGAFLVGAKTDSGNAILAIERATRDQGQVTVRIGGGSDGVLWHVRQNMSADDLFFVNNTANRIILALKTTGLADYEYGGRFKGSDVPTSGAGVEISYSGGTGTIAAMNRDDATRDPLIIDASSISFRLDGVEYASVSGASLLTNGFTAGYLGMPQNVQTGAYQIVLADNGKHISITTGGVTIPANGTTAFPIGATVWIYNNSAANQTISITTDTLRLAGTATTGARTLAQRGLCMLTKVAATEWVASGTGVS